MVFSHDVVLDLFQSLSGRCGGFLSVLRQKRGPFTFWWIPIRVGVDFFGRFLVVRGKCCSFLSGRCGGFLSFSIRTLWWIFASTLRIRRFWEGVEKSPVGPLTF